MLTSKDTVRSVKALIKKINKKIDQSIGLTREFWLEFLGECEHWLSRPIRQANKFVVGRWYDMTFITDSDLYVPLLITKRTKCFINFIYRGEVKRAKIHSYQGVEYFLPTGSYSMAPSCSAK